MVLNNELISASHSDSARTAPIIIARRQYIYFMKSNLYKIFIGIFCMNFCFGCSGSTSSLKVQNDTDKRLPVVMDSNYQKVGYDTTILLIEKKAANNVSWDELFGIKEFIDLYEHGSFYIDNAIEFLSRGESTPAQKKISINSMQKVRLEDYIRLCKECKFLYDSGKISEDILKWAIAPNLSNKYLIVRNYENTEVVEFLNSIKSDPKVSEEFKKSIEKILSGISWESIKEINPDAN